MGLIPITSYLSSNIYGILYPEKMFWNHHLIYGIMGTYLTITYFRQFQSGPEPSCSCSARNDSEAMYAEEWEGWDDFLGIILDFKEARGVECRGVDARNCFVFFVVAE